MGRLIFEGELGLMIIDYSVLLSKFTMQHILSNLFLRRVSALALRFNCIVLLFFFLLVYVLVTSSPTSSVIPLSPEAETPRRRNALFIQIVDIQTTRFILFVGEPAHTSPAQHQQKLGGEGKGLFATFAYTTIAIDLLSSSIQHAFDSHQGFTTHLRQMGKLRYSSTQNQQ
jgi:hypothetical protein